MDKKVACLFILTLFTTTTHTITWSNWWPFSAWTTRKLTAEQKAIRNIIKNCPNTGLDTKFNLEHFLEKEQPRTVYEWVQFLKINYFLALANQQLATIAANPDQYYFREGGTVRNRIAQVSYWNGQANGYTNQRKPLESRLSFLPSIQFSLADYNYLKPECADQILTRLKNSFPYLTATSSITSPLPADQISILLQIMESLPKQQQKTIKTALEQNSIAQIFFLFQLWEINSTSPKQPSAEKTAIIEKVITAAWQASPDAITLQTLQATYKQKLADLKYCEEGVEAHDLISCDGETAQVQQLETNLKSKTAATVPLEEAFRQKFSKQFMSDPLYLLAIPPAISQTITRYLNSYYPELTAH